MGKNDNGGTIMCPKCNGSGEVWVKCPWCRGSQSLGKDKDRNDIPCYSCTAGEVTNTCDRCGGIGEIAL